jgi:hypothetical protein
MHVPKAMTCFIKENETNPQTAALGFLDFSMRCHRATPKLLSVDAIIPSTVIHEYAWSFNKLQPVFLSLVEVQVRSRRMRAVTPP